MSKPANPFLENGFAKYFDFPKTADPSQWFKGMSVAMPGFDAEALMAMQRKNFQAFAAANQAATEGMQAVLRRQNEIMRQTMQESSAMLNQVMTSVSPEEKVTRQAELTKSVLDRAMSNMKEITEMVSKANYGAMEVISNRVGEGLEEFREAVKTTGAK